MKTVAINLYAFNELSDKAKQKAIEEHREFMLSAMGAQIGRNMLLIGVCVMYLKKS